jgi:transposase-like protein
MLALPLYCPVCGRSATVKYEPFTSGRKADLVVWTCPHCSRANSLKFPGKLLAVTKGHGDSSVVH